MVLQSFWGGTAPRSNASSSRPSWPRGREKNPGGGGGGLKRGHDEPAEVSATPAAPPHLEGPQALWLCCCCCRCGQGGGSGGVEGIEAAGRRGACEALGDPAAPTTADIVSAVVALVELHDIITTMVACAHAEDIIRKYEKNTSLAVVICSDATVFHNASATHCDVFVDLWDDRGAHHDGQAWASWCVYDGGDDMVRIVAMYCTHVVRWGGNRWLRTSAVLHLMLQACYYMPKIWRHVGPVPMDQRQRYACMVAQFTKALKAPGWSVPVWVHGVVCHNGAHLQRSGNFIKFSSIPTEWRNKSFKMDIRQCFQGWKLSKPYVTRWELSHALHRNALDWGICFWFGEKGLGREGIRFGMQRIRKKHRAPKHM